MKQHRSNIQIFWDIIHYIFNFCNDNTKAISLILSSIIFRLIPYLCNKPKLPNDASSLSSPSPPSSPSPILPNNNQPLKSAINPGVAYSTIKQLMDKFIDDSGEDWLHCPLSAPIRSNEPSLNKFRSLSFTSLYDDQEEEEKESVQLQEEAEIFKIYQQINNEKRPEFKYDASSVTYIVDLNRKTLHPKDRELGYHGPINDIKEAIFQCNDGDRLLIHNGSYTVGASGHDPDSELRINKTIQLIGLGTNVSFTNNGDSTSLEIITQGHNNVYFENITFDNNAENDGYSTCVYATKHSKIWMNNVKVKFTSRPVVIEPEASLYVQNCDFIGVGLAGTAICVDLSANTVNIQGSTFKNCGYKEDDLGGACVLFDTFYGFKTFGVKCIGNTFEDNLCFPFAQKIGGPKLRQNVLFEFKDNVLFGFNAKRMNIPNQSIDPNKLYFDDLAHLES